jgi:Lysylphosphatidylglycerol synthase TM region
MIASHKSTQYWLLALKVLLLVLALGYIVVTIRDENASVIQNFKDSFKQTHAPYWLFFSALAALNWFLEIYKWRLCVSAWFPTRFKEAMRQSLGSLTASLITPNRIGEYGAKALYFKPQHRKKIVFLNFIHSSSQMAATVFFGMPALVYFVLTYSVTIAPARIILAISAVFLLIFLGYFYRKKQLVIKGFSIENFLKKLKDISIKRKSTLLLLSVARYLVFSFLFFQLVLFFGDEIAYKEAMPIIFTMYLLVSLVPSFFVMDVVIRGGAAVWLFSFLGVSEIAVLSTVMVMWILNTVLPAVWGSFFVLTFKPKTV